MLQVNQFRDILCCDSQWEKEGGKESETLKPYSISGVRVCVCVVSSVNETPYAEWAWQATLSTRESHWLHP